ncbi:putattive exported protein [Bordetella ansorpii]|uniref:Putattive exported protein n=1 Tax=Bordetella ansorpii TaxID=288768 RepID=A0A157PLY0_9BORD|nr:tripartite tricarboxylate transporter substrate binding protein [Bordetella ansorpii]SAI34521.1 putattive exported protein [Bordetella ansorpii]
MRLARISHILALCLLAVAPAAHAAESYPSKPVRWIVPYAAGGGSDFLARTVGQGLTTRLGQPVVIDNKPGGNTAIGASETARSAPDGYTMLSADNGTLVFNPALYQKLSYDPVKDLAPVTLMGRFPMILVAGPALKANDVKGFLEAAKSSGKGLDYGSAGAGSPHHLAMELLKVNTGVNLVHVPYRGAAPALADVAGGQIPAMMVDLAAGAGFIQGGKVRALAVANPTRLPQLPDVPTFAELGYKGVEAAALVGIVVPAATPQPVVDTLNRQLVATINDPVIRQKLVDFGIEPVGNSPAEYRDLLQAERARWHKLIKDLNIKLD